MIPRLGSIILTTQCNFRCSHCAVTDSKYKNMTMHNDLLNKALCFFKKLNTIKVVVFTGGEPTLYYDLLKKGIEKASKYGFITRLVTNGWWGHNEKLAQCMIEEMSKLGLNEINISFDDFHSKFNKIECVANIVKYALEYGLRIGIGILVLPNSKYNKNVILMKLSKILNLEKNELERKIYFLEDQPTPLGRATKLFNKCSEMFKHTPKLYLGCEDIMKTLAILPNGDVKSCCGHAIFHLCGEKDIFYLGNLAFEEIDVIVNRVKKAQGNILYWWLHMQGPIRILTKLGIKEKIKIVSPCQACYIISTKYLAEVKKYIMNNYKEIIVNDIILSDNLKRLERVLYETGIIYELQKIAMVKR